MPLNFFHSIWTCSFYREEKCLWIIFFFVKRMTSKIIFLISSVLILDVWIAEMIIFCWSLEEQTGKLCSYFKAYFIQETVNLFSQFNGHGCYQYCDQNANILLNTLPNLFAGFLLKSIRRRLCASGLKNWGIPSLAL